MARERINYDVMKVIKVCMKRSGSRRKLLIGRISGSEARCPYSELLMDPSFRGCIQAEARKSPPNGRNRIPRDICSSLRRIPGLDVPILERTMQTVRR